MNQQPDANPGMNASGPQVVLVDSQREWDKGLLASGNPATALCWYACCCPCFAHQGNYNRYQYIASGGMDQSINVDDSAPVGECCIVQGAFCQFFGLQAILPCMLREEIRKMLRIRGSPVKDFCSSVFCTPNVIAQSTVQLENEIARIRGPKFEPPTQGNAEAYQLSPVPPAYKTS